MAKVGDALKAGDSRFTISNASGSEANHSLVEDLEQAEAQNKKQSEKDYSLPEQYRYIYTFMRFMRTVYVCAITRACNHMCVHVSISTVF
jgi:hypothetical protein